MKSEDAECPAGAGRLAIGQIEAQPVAPGIAELDPIEIDPALAGLFEHEAGIGL